ncbi:MAG: ribonuclease HII [Xanthomonadales bacterium]|nr:ribonuclease HII [Xanthomonadales bacterium]NIX11754.1 ribonuclease HII [Xanthomonadales bacterium]
MTDQHHRVAGIDEAGRGPLAGPVVVSAVMLPSSYDLPGLDDSKRLHAATREDLFPRIKEAAISWAIEVVEVEEVDRINILRATFKGMERAFAALDPRPTLTLIDGNRAPDLDCEVHTIIEGDHWVPAISAASVLAKVTRDAIMAEWHEKYPVYGFDHNKGYPTPQHLQRLKEHGPCPIHRRSFAPVREALEPDLF